MQDALQCVHLPHYLQGTPLREMLSVNSNICMRFHTHVCSDTGKYALCDHPQASQIPMPLSTPKWAPTATPHASCHSCWKHLPQDSVQVLQQTLPDMLRARRLRVCAVCSGLSGEHFCAQKNWNAVLLARIFAQLINTNDNECKRVTLSFAQPPATALSFWRWWQEFSRWVSAGPLRCFCVDDNHGICARVIVADGLVCHHGVRSTGHGVWTIFWCAGPRHRLPGFREHGAIHWGVWLAALGCWMLMPLHTCICIYTHVRAYVHTQHFCTHVYVTDLCTTHALQSPAPARYFSITDEARSRMGKFTMSPRTSAFCVGVSCNPYSSAWDELRVASRGREVDECFQETTTRTALQTVIARTSR